MDLTDDVVMEILKWVPVTDLLNYRLVCRRWRNLISSKHFKEMHVKSCSPPMVLLTVDSFAVRYHHLLIYIHNISTARSKTLTIGKLDANCSSISSPLIFTYDGLIVYYDRDKISYGDFIFNPITGEKLAISRPMGDSNFRIWGMFFNSLIKKYCILWGSFKTDNVQYFKMLVLGVQQSLRDLKSPPNILIDIPRFPPVVIDDASVTLYWFLRRPSSSCKEAIMAFDTKKEEFSLMPHPGPTIYCRKFDHTNMHIIKIVGTLCFVLLKCEGISLVVNIWSLKDRDRRLWVQIHRVSFNNWDGLTIFIRNNLCDFEVMAFENGELLLRLSCLEGERLYACNLNNGTVRKIGRTYISPHQFFFYVPSFASLRK